MKDAVVPEFIGRIKRDMGHQQFGRAETISSGGREDHRLPL
jgi:hypothetical protein